MVVFFCMYITVLYLEICIERQRDMCYQDQLMYCHDCFSVHISLLYVEWYIHIERESVRQKLLGIVNFMTWLCVSVCTFLYVIYRNILRGLFILLLDLYTFFIYISVFYVERNFKAVSNYLLEFSVLECASCVSGDHFFQIFFLVLDVLLLVLVFPSLFQFCIDECVQNTHILFCMLLCV